jgi:hypothetical protein
MPRSDGLTATFNANDGVVVFDEPYSSLTVTADSVDLWVVGPDGTGASVREPSPQDLCRHQ